MSEVYHVLARFRGDDILFIRQGSSVYDLDGEMIATIEGNQVFLGSNFNTPVAYLDGDIVRSWYSKLPLGVIRGDILHDTYNSTPILKCNDMMALAAGCMLVFRDDSLRAPSQDGRSNIDLIKEGYEISDNSPRNLALSSTGLSHWDDEKSEEARGDSIGDDKSSDPFAMNILSESKPPSSLAMCADNRSDMEILADADRAYEEECRMSMGYIEHVGEKKVWWHNGTHYYPPRNLHGDKLYEYSKVVDPKDFKHLTSVVATRLSNMGYDPINECKVTMEHFGIPYSWDSYLSFLKAIDVSISSMRSNVDHELRIDEAEVSKHYDWKNYWLLTMYEKISEDSARRIVEYCYRKYLIGKKSDDYIFPGDPLYFSSADPCVRKGQRFTGLMYSAIMILLLAWFGKAFPDAIPVFASVGLVGLAFLYFKFFHRGWMRSCR